ncbi:MAG TPA: hypothetical protein VFA55_02510 [Candidatus Kapabacteria bacterium]|nr:hypothetical protein [Candidatus Kapabacteria bacterium]
MKKFLREHWFLLVLITATLATAVVFTRAWEYKKVMSGIISAPIITTFAEMLFHRLLKKKKGDTSDNNRNSWHSLFHRKN